MPQLMIAIPAKTQRSKCRGCGQTIYFAKHPNTGRMHPVSVEHEDAWEPSPLADGQGISHFADCPKADEFRRKK